MPGEAARRGLQGLLALLLLAEAVPLAGASLARLPGDPVLRALRQGETIEAGALDRLAASRRDALAWRERAADRATLALVHLLRAERREGTGPAELDLAAAELGRALRAAPADPYAWTRLALTRLRRGERAGARTALTLSYAAGPREPALRRVRAALAARLDGAE